MGRVSRREGWTLGGALLLLCGAFLALRSAGGPSPDPAADAGGGGGEAPEALAADPARVPGTKPATLDASGKPLPPPGAAAPAEASPADPDAAPVVELRGLVVDEAGKPVARAEVRGRDRAESEAVLDGTVLPVLAVTGTDGRFSVPPGPRRTSRSVTVAAPGLCQRGTEVYLEGNAETRIVMVAACPLRVHVTEDGSDRPVPDALVHAITGPMVAAVWGSALDAPAADVVRTDAAGRTTLPTEGGPAILIVRSKEHVPAIVAGLTVPAVGTDVEVKVARGGALEVTVRGPDGKALAGARVHCEVRPAYRRIHLTGADGRVRFEALPAAPAPLDSDGIAVAFLLVSSRGLEPEALDLEPPSAGSTASLDIRLRPARWIRGHVRTADGAAAPGVWVRAEPRSGPPIFLGQAFDTPDVVSAADGSFVVGPVAVGGWAVHALQADGSARAGVEVGVPKDGEPPVADVILPSTSGRLTVQVVDAVGTGVSSARLELRATRGVYRLAVAEGVTDAAGSARLLGLAPEAARLIVRPPNSAPVSRELTADDFDGRALCFALGSGRIEGRVIGIDRRPRRAHVRICAEVDGCITAGATVESDEAGAFVFTTLSPGIHRVDLNDTDGVLVGGDAMVPTGAANVTLMMATPVEAARLHVELRLVDASTGAPVPVPGFRSEVVLVGRSDPKEWREPHGPDDSEGRFLSFETLPPGTYDGRLIVPGYEDVDLEAITLPLDGEPRTVRLKRKQEAGK